VVTNRNRFRRVGRFLGFLVMTLLVMVLFVVVLLVVVLFLALFLALLRLRLSIRRPHRPHQIQRGRHVDKHVPAVRLT